MLCPSDSFRTSRPNPMSSSGEQLLVQLATYNTNLQAERGLPQNLVDWLAPTLQVANFLSQAPRAPDLVAVGFQELLPLHLGLSGLSKHVIDNRNALILSQIEEHAPNKEKYSLIAKVVNVGVALLVYGRDDGVARRVEDVQTSWTGCGPMYMGNKGAVGIRFRVASSEGGVGEVFTFVNAHLTAHTHKLAHRIADYDHIVRTLLFPPIQGLPKTGSATIYDTSHLFFFGDLNFRLQPLPPSILPNPATSSMAETVQRIMQDEFRPKLVEFDQLVQERDQKSRIFVGLREGEFWRFKCTYKYKLGEVDRYDLKRMPAWTDRIMYSTWRDDPNTPNVSTVTNALYTSIPSYTVSDHKPVVSVLLLPPSPSRTTYSQPPTLRLPPHFKPQVDPLANVKRYTGRVLDRIIGYTWWLLTILGSGPGIVAMLSIGVWGWFRWRWTRDGADRVDV
ncbi:skeletal muscle/kidney enriched inositol 5-phosphatase [Panus rudis PR-1116 ss-1]|nr:skeletal muscle/kidney enriched inositol 5-phosphatase [Panus rudis PR-1116 ss-1]